MDSVVKNRAYFLLAPLAVLLILGGFNVYRQITWKEPTDGVVWAMKGDRLTAIKVDKDGPAYLFNLKKGDVLFSVTHNLAPGKIIIRSKIDLLKNIWQVWNRVRKSPTKSTGKATSSPTPGHFSRPRRAFTSSISTWPSSAC